MDSFEDKFTHFIEILKASMITVNPVLQATLKTALIEAQFDRCVSVGGGSNNVIRKKRVNGYNLFMKERMQQLKMSAPDIDSNHRMTQISEEWNKSTEEVKEGWKAKAKAIPVEEFKIPIRLKKEVKEKKPHQISGYQLFVREKMPELKDKVTPKERMTQIGGMWKALPEEQKESYKTRASAMPPTSS